MYDLLGVVIHAGTATSGHYWAIVKCEGHWIECNDTNVSVFDEQKIASVSDQYEVNLCLYMHHRTVIACLIKLFFVKKRLKNKQHLTNDIIIIPFYCSFQSSFALEVSWSPATLILNQRQYHPPTIFMPPHASQKYLHQIWQLHLLMSRLR